MPDTSPPQGALDAVAPASATPDGIPESALAGPFAVGEYAAALRTRLRSFTRVQVVGELVNLRPSRARVYFELRDAGGALSCAAWRDDWDRMVARAGAAPSEGMQVVVAGGCDYYPGSATSSPGFSFAVSDLRVAGEGDLLVRIDRLRKQLDAEGLLAPQKLLSLPSVPRSIGVITARAGQGARRRSCGPAAPRLGRPAGVGASRPCRIDTRRRRSCARSAISPPSHRSTW